MKYKVRKVGASIGVTIPEYIRKTLDLKIGDTITIDTKAKKIIIEKEENK